jgi:hypothetical protein
MKENFTKIVTDDTKESFIYPGIGNPDQIWEITLQARCLYKLPNGKLQPGVSSIKGEPVYVKRETLEKHGLLPKVIIRESDPIQQPVDLFIKFLGSLGFYPVENLCD